MKMKELQIEKNEEEKRDWHKGIEGIPCEEIQQVENIHTSCKCPYILYGKTCDYGICDECDIWKW